MSKLSIEAYYSESMANQNLHLKLNYMLNFTVVLAKHKSSKALPLWHLST